jgi:thiosulfate reductase cytochrome b subunit
MISQLRKLVLGETWTLPFGVALTLLAGLALDAAGPAWWHRAGGFVVLAGALATLAASLHGGARRRIRSTRSAASSGARRGSASPRRRAS